MAGPKTARRAGKQWWRNIFGRLLGWGRDNADLSVEADLALQQAQDNHNMAARAAAGVVAEIKMLKERGAGLEDRLVEVDSDIAALQADGQALVTRKGYASAEEAATDPEFADIQNDLNVLLEDKAVVERELADYQASITALEPQVDSAREAIRDSQAAVEQLTRDRSDVHRMERQSAAQAAVNRNAAQLNSALNLDAPSMGDIKDRAARWVGGAGAQAPEGRRSTTTCCGTAPSGRGDEHVRLRRRVLGRIRRRRAGVRHQLN